MKYRILPLIALFYSLSLAIAQVSTPAVEVLPGSTKYLDYKYGFRDVRFGQTPEEIAGMKIDGEPNNRLLKEYLRASDVLTLNQVPLEFISYNFYENKLCQVYFHCEIKGGPFEPFEDFLVSLYGKPTSKKLGNGLLGNIKSTEWLWKGERVDLFVREGRFGDKTTVSFYLRDSIRYGALTKKLEEIDSNAAAKTKDGL